MARLDIDQERALTALKFVNEAVTNNYINDYASYVESLPMMIHNSGLRNTLAFALLKGYKEKGNKAWKAIFRDILAWLGNKTLNFFDKTFTNIIKQDSIDKDSANNLLTQILEWKNDQYLFVTQETLAFVNWLRKLAKTQNNGTK